MELNLSEGSIKRLERIKELKECSTKDALEFALSVGWLATERRYMQEQRPEAATREELALIAERVDRGGFNPYIKQR